MKLGCVIRDNNYPPEREFENFWTNLSSFCIGFWAIIFPNQFHKNHDKCINAPKSIALLLTIFRGKISISTSSHVVDKQSTIFDWLRMQCITAGNKFQGERNRRKSVQRAQKRSPTFLSFNNDLDNGNEANIQIHKYTGEHKERYSHAHIFEWYPHHHHRLVRCRRHWEGGNFGVFCFWFFY